MSGVFAGIYLKTGQNVDPDTLLIETGDTIAENLGDSHWGSVRPLLILVSVFSTLIVILQILSKWAPGILVAIGGYLGAIFMVTLYPHLELPFS